MRPLVGERPHERSARYEADFGVTSYDASVLSSDLPLAHYFEALAATPGIPGKKAANFLLNTLLGALNDRSIAIADSPLSAEKIGGLLKLVEDGTLALSQAKEVLAVMLDAPDRDPAAVAKELGFEPTDAGELDTLCDQVIAANPDKVAEIKGGNEKLLNWLTGQVMKASSTKPNPKQVTDLLKGKLG